MVCRRWDSNMNTSFVAFYKLIFRIHDRCKNITMQLFLRNNVLFTSFFLKIVDVPPPTINEVNRTADCTKETMNYYNCSTQSWSLVLEVTCPANLSQLYVTPNNVQLNYSNKASRSGDYIAILRYLSICLSIHCPYIFISHPPTHFNNLFIYLSIYLSIYLISQLIKSMVCHFFLFLFFVFLPPFIN